MSQACSMRALSVTFKPDRMVCIVQLEGEAPLYTTPPFAAALRASYPRLLQHACVNAYGTTFGDCLSHTSLPHVLEHLVIDWQVSYDDGEYVGTTEWLSLEEKTAKIEVSYQDDLVALKALNQALCQMNDVLTGVRGAGQ